MKNKTIQDYYTKEFDKVQGNCKKLWNFIGKIGINTKKNTRDHQVKIELVDGNTTVSNNYDLATMFNNYFTTINVAMANQIPKSSISHDMYNCI